MNLSLFRKRKYIRILGYIGALLIINLGIFGLQKYKKSLPLVVKAALPVSCTSTTPPIGALIGDPAPIWCYNSLSNTSSSLIYKQNSLLDEFNQSALFASTDNDYTIIDTLDNTGHSTSWKHLGQLIIDSNGHSSAIRPDQTVTFAEDSLILEIDTATNMPKYNENISHTISISPQQSISQKPQTNELRCSINGTLKNISCMLGDSTITTRTLYANQLKAWKVCDEGIPASQCQNRFRFEITAGGMRIFVNSVLLSIDNQLVLPETFLSSKHYIYLLSENKNTSGNPYRFYWDRLHVNPVTPASAAPTMVPTTNQLDTKTTSIQFKGNGFTRVPHARSFNVPDGWTIEMWFKDESPTGFNHDTRYLLIKGDTDNTENIPYLLGIEQNSLFVGTRYDSQNKVITYNLQKNRVRPSQWHHVAATLDTTKKELILYIDGLAVAKSEIAAYSVKDNNQPLYIGKNGAKNHWIGKVDDVRIWNKPRTPEAIRNSYLTELQKPQEHLVGNWKFNEGKGKIAIDFSTKQEHMTIVNGEWSVGVR